MPGNVNAICFGKVIVSANGGVSGEKAYLLRLCPEKDPAPLVAAAKRYLDEDVQYDYPDLIFFAGLLIYRAVRPTPRWQKITDLILNMACRELDKLLNKVIHKGNVPVMVCSQLVYQCYADCGTDYRIILKDGLLETGLPGTIRLADMIDDAWGENLRYPSDLFPGNLDLEVLAQEFYSALNEPSDDLALLGSGELRNTVNLAADFLDLVEQVLKHSGIDIPVPALFVAPSDLLCHAVNLQQYGTAMISRI
ncbi:MAG: hypothetical protein LUE94_00465 [Clostridiales bacterium]|nr:hypothetical protein [Clostridiales bacterium]